MPTVLTLVLSMPQVEGEEQETWIIMTLGLIHTNMIFTMKEANCKHCNLMMSKRKCGALWEN